MTHKMANIIYRNHKLGNITVSPKVINRIYTEADTCMFYANMYNPHLEQDRETESQIIGALIEGNYEKAQSLLDDFYKWVK